MQQQLLQGTVNIVPDTMNQILSQLQIYLNASSLQASVLDNIIKALFYGLWNFDKMINQHNLSTAISLMPHSIPKQHRKNGIKFYERFFSYLFEKWNYIDKHRINKFMQLMRYLIRQSINFCKINKIKLSRAQQMLKNTVFADMNQRGGMLYHAADIYFDVITEFCVNHNEEFSFKSLSLFQYLLKNHNIEHFRYHIIEQIYGKYKQFLIDSFANQSNELEQQLGKIIEHFIEVAKLEEKDLNRKNIYLLVGYLKSEHVNFPIYEAEKRLKASQQKQKIKKKLSKHKVKLIKESKQKRKQKNKKANKNKKIISKHRFEVNKGQGNKKFIQDF